MNRLLVLMLPFAIVMYTIQTHAQQDNTIKFDYNFGHIYIKGGINDSIPATFVYDTGAADFYLDSAFVSHHKIIEKPTNIYHIGGIGSSKKTRVEVANDTLSYHVSNIRKTSTYSVILDLRAILGKQIDGLLGKSSLFDKPFVIDYSKEIIYPVTSLKDYDCIPIKVIDDKMVVPISVNLDTNTSFEGYFCIDTGSPSTLLNSNINEQVRLKSNQKAYYKSTEGTGGTATGYTFFAQKLTMGSFTLEAIPLSISTDQKGFLSNPNYLGILGNDILEKFTVVIDPKNQFLGLKPAENYQKKYKHIFKSIGFKEHPDETSSWILSFAYKDSPALKAGLKEDDIIVAINDVPVKELRLAEFTKNIKRNQKVRLKVKRNEKYVTIKFKWKPVLKL